MWRLFFTRLSVSVLEAALSCEHHGDTSLIAGFNDFKVAI
jgi:hypothetical protein